jgi:hypothetical protein
LISTSRRATDGEEPLDKLDGEELLEELLDGEELFDGWSRSTSWSWEELLDGWRSHLQTWLTPVRRCYRVLPADEPVLPSVRPRWRSYWWPESTSGR